MNGRDLWQVPCLCDLGRDAHLHQVFRDIGAQSLERWIVVHGTADTWTRQRDLEGGAKGAIRGQWNDAVGKQECFVHIIGD